MQWSFEHQDAPNGGPICGLLAGVDKRSSSAWKGLILEPGMAVEVRALLEFLTSN